MGQFRTLFVYFQPFHIKKINLYAWDSNLGRSMVNFFYWKNKDVIACKYQIWRLWPIL